jgi:hypothetical protein
MQVITFSSVDAMRIGTLTEMFGQRMESGYPEKAILAKGSFGLWIQLVDATP